MSENNNKKMLLKLSHFNPTLEDKFGNQIIDYLVLDSLSTQGPLLSQDPIGIKEHVKNVFKLDYDELEIISSCERLVRKELVTKLGTSNRDEFPSFKILSNTEENISRNINYLNKLETEIFDEWKEELKLEYRKYPEVISKLDSFVTHLHKFISKILKYHGIESVYLLFPKNEKAAGWVENINYNFLDEIDEKNDFIKKVIKVELASFFKCNNPRRMKYISSLFHSSFIWHLIQVDENTTNLLKSLTQGQKLVLDANILYFLVGFNGHYCLKSAHSLLNFAKKLGYKLYVTTKTIDEFHHSVNNRYTDQKEKKPIPRDLLKIALDFLDCDSFIANYWGEYAKHNTTIDEFVSEKSHIKSLLNDLGIEIYGKYREEIEGSEELKDEESLLRTVCGPDINPKVVEHDAFHRILINKIRQKPRYQFHNAIAWFLSSDRKLLDYSRVARKGEASLPFCITPEQWIQINRPFLSRSINENEFNDSFYVLVTQPYIRSLVSTVSIDDAYEKVLNQLSRFDKMNPQLAMNIVADRHFMISMTEIKDDEIIHDRLESKFIDIAKDLELEKEKTEMEKKAFEQKVDHLEDEKVNLSKIIHSYEDNNKSLINKNQELSDALNNLSKEKHGLDFKVNEMANEIKTVNSNHSQAIKQISDLKNLIKWIVFSILLCGVSFTLWYSDSLFKFQWLSNHKNLIFLKILSQCIFICALLNITLPKKWEIWLGLMVAFFIALISISV